MKTGAELADQMPAFLRVEQVVKVVDGYFEFYLDGQMVYDFKPADAAHALRWLEHMAQKSWFTRQHVEQYARLAAELYGAGYI